MARTWHYFDFDKYWNIFKDVWNLPESQALLKTQMDEWCNTTYNPSVPLWQYTKTRYWENKIKGEIAKESISKNYLKQYKTTMQNVLPIKYANNHTLLSCYVDRVYASMFDEYKPKDGTIDSFILQNGHNCLAPILYQSARYLYPDTYVELVKDMNDNDIVLLPEHKIAFDLLSFYHFKHDHDPTYNVYIDSCYDMILDGFQSILSLETIDDD